MEHREYRDGEAVEVGDVVCLGTWAFSTAIVVAIEGNWIVLERPHMRASRPLSGKANGETLYERFTTGRSHLRVFVTGKSGAKDNRCPSD